MIPSRIHSAAAPRDRRPIYEWAREHVVLSAPITLPGAFNVEHSRHLIPCFDDLDDCRVRSLVLLAPVRGAKTIISDVWQLSLIARSPGPMMIIMQTERASEDLGQARTLKNFNNCQPVSELLPRDPRKRTLESMEFLNGMQYYMVGPSINNLQSKGIQYMICDEPWCYGPGILTEALGRQGDYEKMETSKFLGISQGGAPGGELDQMWKEGTQDEWSVPCQKCGLHFIAAWGGRRDDGSFWGMRWNEHRTATGYWDVPKCIDSIRYECQHCGHPHLDNRKTHEAWNLAGKYERKNPDALPEKRSRHYTAVITRKWAKLVEEYLNAHNQKKNGVLLPLVQFYQKRLALNRNEESFAPDEKVVIRTDHYEVTSAWGQEAFRFMTVDVQDQCVDFWWCVRAWADSGESRLIAWGRASSFDELRLVQEKHTVKDPCVFVDVAYEHDTVCAHVARWGWTGLWGKSINEFTFTDGTQRVTRSFSPIKRKETPQGIAEWYYWAQPTIADTFHMLRQGKGVPWAVPPDVGTEYIEHLNAEVKRKIPNRFNQSEWKWVKKNSKAQNHLLDCERMQLVAAAQAELPVAMVKVESMRGEVEQDKETIEV